MSVPAKSGNHRYPNQVYMAIVISVIMLHVGPTQVDRTIDLCGGPPRGTGLQNLRECIIGILTLHKGKKKLLLVLIMLP